MVNLRRVYRAWLVLLPLSCGIAKGSTLLSEIDFHMTGGVSPCQPSLVEFYLAHSTTPDEIQLSLGKGDFWGPGESGVAGFGPSFEGFAQFTQRLTDGSDDYLFLMTAPMNCAADQGTARHESIWLNARPDLIGNSIDSIVLYVSNVHIQIVGAGQDWDADVRWQFWGTPTPEPAAIFLLVVGAAVVLPRRAQR